MAVTPDLAELAWTLAHQPASWRPAVHFDPSRRHYRRILAEPGYEAWLLTWWPGQRTGVHDHGGSAGVFFVLDGKLHETVLDGPRENRFEHPAGTCRPFGARHIHDLGNRAAAPAISLHLYAPALTTITRYRRDDGHLRPQLTEHAGAHW